MDKGKHQLVDKADRSDVMRFHFLTKRFSATSRLFLHRESIPQPQFGQTKKQVPYRT